jgi:hypothetical protein
MDPYIQLKSYSNGRLLTASGAPTPGAPETLSLESPPNPDLNIELGGQKWSFQVAPLTGSGAYFVTHPGDDCLDIPVIAFDPDGDPMAADANFGGPTQLWYLFADPQGSYGATGQPNCFLMNSLCMNSTHPFSHSSVRHCPYTKVLDVKDGSKAAGAGVHAFPIKPEVYSNQPTTEYGNQLWTPGAGDTWPIAPYSLPPNSGLQGNSNYYMGNYVVDLVRSAKVEVKIGGDLDCDNGVSFQFNGFGASGELEVWQQYVIFLNQGATSLMCVVNNWTLQQYWTWTPGQTPIVYDRAEICELPEPYLPAGTSLTTDLTFDPVLGTITAVTFAAKGPDGPTGLPQFEGQVRIDLTQTGGVPSSILSYQYVVVGEPGGAFTTFGAGGGIITYRSNELISVSPSLSFQSAWDSGATRAPIPGGTGEDSNMNYGFLPPSTLSPATRLEQSFQLQGYGGP